MEPTYKTVGEIKKGNSFYANEETTVIEIAKQLVNSHYTGMPVIDKNNRVIGVVSEVDILRALQESRNRQGPRIKDYMTSSPIVIKEDTSLEEASKILKDHKIHRLPVVKDGGELIGTITRHDLIRAWIGLPINNE
ncbi:MAG: CBS domain-containing protein [Nitrospiria bacterium]